MIKLASTVSALATVVGAVLVGPTAAQGRGGDPIDQLLAQATAAPSAGIEGEVVICRTMTDLSRRDHRERVCMRSEQWSVLVAAAHRPAPSTGIMRVSALRSASSSR